MQDKYQFEAIIHKVPDLDGTYVIFPFDLRKMFGKGRIKVQATFDGYPYDGSIVNMGIKNPDGGICYIIGITKQIRRSLHKQVGDKILVTIESRESGNSVIRKVKDEEFKSNAD